MEPEYLNSLVRAGKKRVLFEPTSAQGIDMGRPQIEKLLHHRDPFLFIDRVTAIDVHNLSIAATRRIDPADPLFRGHFPGNPIYPGVLQLEIMGQLGLCLLGLFEGGRYAGVPEHGTLQARALKIHHAIFLTAVRPDDELTILAKVIEANDYTALCAGQLIKGDTIYAYAVMEVYFVEA
jgi:3-hydroxymyristoyl/3-hydroxydecanoyl-(acyl carrier protein) dehydratase